MAYESFDPRIGDKRVPVTDTTEIPHSAVAQLSIRMKNRQMWGTGFLAKVGGYFVILTAAHNLYHKVRGKAERVVVFLGRDQDHYPQGVIVRKDVDLEVPREYIEGQKGCDYGIISLIEEDYDFYRLPYFILWDPRKINQLKNTDIYMNSYPGDTKGNTQMKIKLTNPRVAKMRIYYKDATSYGSSGSPIYIVQDDTPLAIGIHVEGFTNESEYNKAIAMRPEIRSGIEQLVKDFGNRYPPNRFLRQDLSELTDLKTRRPFDRSSYHETKQQSPQQSLYRSTSVADLTHLEAVDYSASSHERQPRGVGSQFCYRDSLSTPSNTTMQIRHNQHVFNTTKETASRWQFCGPENFQYEGPVEKWNYPTASKISTKAKSDQFQLQQCSPQQILSRSISGEQILVSEHSNSATAKQDELKTTQHGYSRRSPGTLTERTIPMPIGSSAQFGLWQPIKADHSIHPFNSHDASKEEVISLTSTLPLPPKVIQLLGDFEQMKSDILKKDTITILPPTGASCAVRTNFINSLQVLSSAGIVLITTSLCELMHISSPLRQPDCVFLEVFGAVVGLPPFVLCIVYDHCNKLLTSQYSECLTKEVLHTIRTFADVKVASIFGNIIPQDYETPTALQNAIVSIQNVSARFCNPNALYVDNTKSSRISVACLAAVALQEIIEPSCRTVELRLGSRDALNKHFYCMNQKVKSRVEHFGQAEEYTSVYSSFPYQNKGNYSMSSQFDVHSRVEPMAPSISTTMRMNPQKPATVSLMSAPPGPFPTHRSRTAIPLTVVKPIKQDSSYGGVSKDPSAYSRFPHQSKGNYSMSSQNTFSQASQSRSSFEPHISAHAQVADEFDLKTRSQGMESAQSDMIFNTAKAGQGSYSKEEPRTGSMTRAHSTSTLMDINTLRTETTPQSWTSSPFPTHISQMAVPTATVESITQDFSSDRVVRGLGCLSSPKEKTSQFSSIPQITPVHEPSTREDDKAAKDSITFKESKVSSRSRRRQRNDDRYDSTGMKSIQTGIVAKLKATYQGQA